jgi:hypothetical protein
VHDPIGTIAPGGPALVINEGLFHPHGARVVVHRAILPSRLPITHLRRPIGPRTIPILPVQRTEKIPLQIPALQLGFA